ncbi:MAG: 3-keto-5-aminohexanoate cleavage protein [Halieaceae bacterium]|jgi:3-keto-5-aminohexanoate cleavage enzyme|nr:3-keto-5-aminohexanoate cleavage protein [Halieaceae bacterium]
MANLPLIIAVAPNGARRTRVDHPALPLSADDLARTARQCGEAGASMIHVHVRDEKMKHSLNVERYRTATSAIRAAVGPDMIIQITTEAVGAYSCDQQMEVVRKLKPEAVSLALSELCPVTGDDRRAAAFFNWLQREHISPQYILYSNSDIQRFQALRQQGIIPGESVSVLYVRGRHDQPHCDPGSPPPPMPGFQDKSIIWSVCAFGPIEASDMQSAAELGGHCRVGFENNLNLISGEVAPDNAALVTQTVELTSTSNRPIASPDEARSLLGMA